MSGVTKKTSKVTKTNSNEGAGTADSVTKRKRNRKYLTTTNKTHLKALTTFFVTTTFLLHHATAEKYIGMNHCCYFHGYMAKGQLNSDEFMRSSFLPKCQPKIARISALEVY